MKLTEESIAAMAVAAVAEMTGTDAKRLRIISFGEVQKSSLEKYIEEHGLRYRKYQLGDEKQ